LGGIEDGNPAKTASGEKGIADDEVEMLEMEELDGGRNKRPVSSKEE
jgi:hypothetical protein